MPATASPSIGGARKEAPREIGDALRACRTAFLATGLFSMAVNLLMLTGPLYMLQVYDRVLSSRSMSTLAALTILIVVLYAFQAFFDFVRSRVLARVGVIVESRLNSRVFEVAIAQGLVGSAASKLQPINDLQALRQFLSGPGPIALFDLPWVPVYIAIVFLLHPWLGVLGTAGALIVLCLAVVNDLKTRKLLKEANRAQLQGSALVASSSRNAEVITAMGMAGDIRDAWRKYQNLTVKAQLAASDAGGGIAAVSKAFRLLLQSLALGVGAILVIEQVATPGIMIAGSILIGRALAPMDQAIAHWKGFVGTRQAASRLSSLLASIPPEGTHLLLPAPRGKLDVDGVSAVPPGQQRLILDGVRFSLEPGDAVGVIGPSAAGKSTLARLLVGVWIPSRGAVRLDGATLDQWTRRELGRHVGYLPQDVELFDGTVAQNIARFDENASDEAVVDAAQRAGAHEMIVHLPQGYETRIGEWGSTLSAGQRQRIGLARALFRDPVLVVLDEPNSNLDNEGDAALTDAIRGLRTRKKIVVVITHRPSAIAAVDLVLMLKDGRQVAFGPKEQVLKQMTQLRPQNLAATG